jgi:hypothetical protein
MVYEVCANNVSKSFLASAKAVLAVMPTMSLKAFWINCDCNERERGGRERERERD